MVSDKKDTTCAVLNLVNDKFLICHATLSSFWTLPKGIKNPGELFVEAAVREMYEETGIIVDSDKLIYTGIFKYKPAKNMAVFIYRTKKELDIQLMNCISEFYNKDNNIYFKEVDSYKYVTLEESKDLLNKKQYSVIKAVLRNII